MKCAIIVAASRNNVIGANGQMPWRLPREMQLFKATTLNHSVIMGRKTFESIGKPLVQRRNIVVTRNAGWQTDGVESATSLEAALALCAREDEAFLIGGGTLYAEALAKGLVDTVYLSRIDLTTEGDTFFPELESDWRKISETVYPPDEKNRYGFTFARFDRLKS